MRNPNAQDTGDSDTDTDTDSDSEASDDEARWFTELTKIRSIDKSSI